MTKQKEQEDSLERIYEDLGDLDDSLGNSSVEEEEIRELTYLFRRLIQYLQKKEEVR